LSSLVLLPVEVAKTTKALLADEAVLLDVLAELPVQEVLAEVAVQEAEVARVREEVLAEVAGDRLAASAGAAAPPPVLAVASPAEA